MDVTQYLLLGNALLLGFRHGIDWDHIAAITDIVGTTTTNDSDRQIKMSQLQSHAIGLSSVYALGHAFIVVLLGVAAICFSKILPNWVDPIMERVVGFTLLFLSGYILYSLAMFVRGKGQIKLQSRWMLLISLVRKMNAKLCHNSSRKNELEDNKQVMAYGWRTAFGIGMIHGIGAETGTQVLLIAALGGAATHGLGLAMLATFVIGLLISNTLIAALSSFGFAKSAGIKQVCFGAAMLTAAFSLIVGTYFVAGQADRLPNPEKTFAFLAPQT